MLLQDLIDWVQEDGFTPRQVEIFVDRDDTQSFGYEPSITSWPVNPTEISEAAIDGYRVKIWITLAPCNAYVVLPDEEADAPVSTRD